jgi:hypothetical protein
MRARHVPVITNGVMDHLRSIIAQQTDRSETAVRLEAQLIALTRWACLLELARASEEFIKCREDSNYYDAYAWSYVARFGCIVWLPTVV